MYRKKILKITKQFFVIAFAINCLAACEGGDIVLREYDAIKDYRLLNYLPDKPSKPENRVNPEGIAIRNVTRYSNGSVEITLFGIIESGIPEGLMFDENPLPTPFTPPTPLEAPKHYAGRGDYYKNSSSKMYESFDLSMEEKAKHQYAVITLDGLIKKDEININIKETNDALRLYSDTYIYEHYPTNATIVIGSTESYKKNFYNYNPNYFLGVGQGQGEERGGYPFFIWNNPSSTRIVRFDVEYPDGKKEVINIDYTAVTFLDDMETPRPLEDIILYNPAQITKPGHPFSPNTNTDNDFYTNYSYPIQNDENLTAGVAYYSYTLSASPTPSPNFDSTHPLLIRPVYTPGSTKFKYKKEDFTCEIDTSIGTSPVTDFPDDYSFDWNDTDGGMELGLKTAPLPGINHAIITIRDKDLDPAFPGDDVPVIKFRNMSPGVTAEPYEPGYWIQEIVINVYF